MIAFPHILRIEHKIPNSHPVMPCEGAILRRLLAGVALYRSAGAFARCSWSSECRVRVQGLVKGLKYLGSKWHGALLGRCGV